jgi:hypothetical protein
VCGCASGVDAALARSDPFGLTGSCCFRAHVAAGRCLTPAVPRGARGTKLEENVIGVDLPRIRTTERNRSELGADAKRRRLGWRRRVVLPESIAMVARDCPLAPTPGL